MKWSYSIFCFYSEDENERLRADKAGLSTNLETLRKENDEVMADQASKIQRLESDMEALMQ